MINRRFNDPASTNGLEMNALQISFNRKVVKEGGRSFFY